MAVYQTDSNIMSLHSEGCYFTCIYHYRDIIGAPTSLDQLESFWRKSLALRYIDEDFNIISPNGICELMDIPLKYRDAHYPPTQPLEPMTYRILKLFRPSNKFSHFVVGLDRGNISFDPIRGGSLTAKDPMTYVESVRLYDIVG